MKTVEALFQQYGKKFVELEKVAAEYLGLGEKAAKERAAKGELDGIRAFQVREKNGAPWFVDIEQLAEVLDKKARQ